MTRTFTSNLFGASIASRIAAKLGPRLLPATLSKPSPRVRASATPADGTRATWTDYAARGFATVTVGGADGGRTVSAEVVLLGASIAGGVVPESGDRVTIAGDTWAIADGDSAVDGDPAGATWTCQARRA